MDYNAFMAGRQNSLFRDVAKADVERKTGKKAVAGDAIPLRAMEFAALESAEDRFVLENDRADAMSAVLAWLDDGDYTYSALDDAVQTIADFDDDWEVSDSETDLYNSIWGEVANALVSMGANAETVGEFVNSEDDEAGAKIGEALGSAMESCERSNGQIIMAFALESVPVGIPQNMALESVEKVVRDGEVMLIRKPLRKKRRTAKQRQAMKKAQRKSHTGAARARRAKSMRMRESRGMND